MENKRCPNQPHGRRPPEKPGRAGHGGTPLNISEKKYLMGGQVGVDIYDTNNADTIDVAFELAKRSFCSDQSIETCHSRKRLKP
jgi:hypothetical protein